MLFFNFCLWLWCCCRGVWKATVHGITKSWAWLKNWTGIHILLFQHFCGRNYLFSIVLLPWLLCQSYLICVRDYILVLYSAPLIYWMVTINSWNWVFLLLVSIEFGNCQSILFFNCNIVLANLDLFHLYINFRIQIVKFHEITCWVLCEITLNL